MFDLFNELELPFAIFFAVFSMGIALFQTLFLKSLFGLRFKSWLFFVLNPLSIILSYFIYPPLSGFIFVFLLASLILTGIIAALFGMASGTVQYIKERNDTKKKQTPWWQILLGSAGGIIIFISFIFLRGGVLFVLILITIIASIIWPNNKNRFLRLQDILPTAPIRSIPVGLIEVTGKVKYIDPLIAPLKSKRCAGYKYVVEKITTDSDGDKSYTTITDKTECNQFILADETGEIKVDGNELEMLFFKPDEQYSAGGKRYSLYLLKEEDEILLIGKAENRAGELVIIKDELKKIFALAPLAAVIKYNINKPLLKSLAVMLIVLACLIASVLLADINVSDNMVEIGWN